MQCTVCMHVHCLQSVHAVICVLAVHCVQGLHAVHCVNANPLP